MRRFRQIIWVLILIGLTACAPQNGNGEQLMEMTSSSSDEQTSIPSVESKPTVAPSSSLTPTALPVQALMPDHDIPDVVFDPTEKANSNYTLYEDEDHIYYIRKIKPYSGDLLIINKNNGSAKTIANDCSNFAVYNGKIYHNGYDDNVVNFSNSITEYDIGTDASTLIIRLDYPIYQIACYNDKLYFSRESEIILDSGETYDNLYVADLNGSNIKKIQEDAHSFCIYNDRIYYTSVGGAEGGGLFKYNKDSSKNKEEIYGYILYYFDISFDKIFGYYDGTWMYDISTGNTKMIHTGLDNNAIAGQYFIDCIYGENSTPKVVKAYDFLACKEYIFWDISSIADAYTSIEIQTAGDNIYVCIENRKLNEFNMYRVKINNGEAVIEHVATIEDDE